MRDPHAYADPTEWGMRFGSTARRADQMVMGLYDSVERLSRREQHGFKIHDLEIVFRGLCPDCQAAGG